MLASLLGYLDVILCFKAVILVLKIKRVIPLVLGKVDTKMQIRTTLDCLSYCTYVPKRKNHILTCSI